MGVEASSESRLRLHEQTLLLLRELCVGQNRCKDLALGAKFLPRVLKAVVEASDVRIVRAGLAVLRSFAFSEEVREELSVFTDGAIQCVQVTWKHMQTAGACEHGLALVASLTMRNPRTVEKLNDGDRGILRLAMMSIRALRGKPGFFRGGVQ